MSASQVSWLQFEPHPKLSHQRRRDSVSEIYSKISDYVQRRITLEQLERWLVSMLPTYFANPDSSAAELAGLVELGLAEIQAGITTQQSLRKLLSQHVTTNLITPEPDPHETSFNETGASSRLTAAKNLDWLDPSPSWSSVPQVESV